MTTQFKILAVSGSLRATSLNSLFLRTMAKLCPEHIMFSIYPALDQLPFFNPDDDVETFDCTELQHWRHALAQADLVLLVSPEYAHGVTGVIKNALDWIVSSGELMDKPLAFPNLSIRADVAQSQLAETLKLMGCNLLEDCSPKASVAAPYVFTGATEQMLIEHPEIGARLKALWRQIEISLTLACELKN